MTAETRRFSLDTRGNVDILDVTDRLRDMVRESGITTGQLTVMVAHSTAAVSTIEFEPGLVEHDIAAAMEALAPEDGSYEHEKTWNDDNGHSHVRATLMGPSLAVPIVDGELPLGTWQHIVVLDFDTRPRTRDVVVSLVGE